MNEEEKKNKDPVKTPKEVFKSVFSGLTVGTDEEVAARDEEIRKHDEEVRKEARENSFRNSGIAEKFKSVELSDILRSGIAEMKDKDGNVITDINVFEKFISDIAEGKPRGLWLCGKYGTGKSVFAIALMHELCRRGVSCSYFKTHEVMQRLDDVKWHLSHETRAGIVKELCYADFRIFDEIGRYPDSKWEQFILFDVTNKCYESYKSMLFISNLTRNELGEFLGGAATDRFKGLGMTIEFSGKSFRGSEKELYTK